MLFKDLVEEFNIAAQTAYNKGYEELSPQFERLAFKFNSGDVSSTKFPVTKIMSKIKAFTGDRQHQNPADGFFFEIANDEFDGSVDIKRRDLLRAQAVNSLIGLDLYVKEIQSLGAEAKDKPYEDLLEWLEAGDTSTYGTTFDGQNMFDTTHDFNNAAGTQSNLLTGTGVTLATLLVDIRSAMAALEGFYYVMSDGSTANSKKRMLNRNPEYVIVCPVGLKPFFEDIRQMTVVGRDGSSTNTLKNTFEVIARHFTDTNDWYLIDVSDPMIKPFIISMEEEPKLETPEMNEFQMREHKVLTWGIEGFSYGIGYGAWWKAVQTTNA